MFINSRPSFEEPTPKHPRLSYSPGQATEQLYPIIPSPKFPQPPKIQTNPTPITTTTTTTTTTQQPIQAIQSPIKTQELSPKPQSQPLVSISHAQLAQLAPIESPVQFPIPSSSLPPPQYPSSFHSSFALPSLSSATNSFPSLSFSPSFPPPPPRAELRRKSEQESLEGLVGLAGLAGLADIASQDSVQLKIEREDESLEEKGMHAAKEELNQLVERVCTTTGQASHVIQDIKASALLNGMVAQSWDNTKVEQVIIKANRCIDNALDRANRQEKEWQAQFTTTNKKHKSKSLPPPTTTTTTTTRPRRSRAPK